jgi:DNA-binding transcriptional ArsR family regulator
LIGDPARAAFLCALLGGQELSASDLAGRAGVAANAASAHFARLIGGRLIDVRISGRNRFYRLADAQVARAVEALAVVALPPRIVGLSQSQSAEQLRIARSCYDHLAGRLGVVVTDALVQRKIVVPYRDDYRLTPSGEEFLSILGVDVEKARAARRQFARQCLDWSERRPHLAGALGAGVREAFLHRRWVERKSGNRSLRITDLGRASMRSMLAIEL